MKRTMTIAVAGITALLLAGCSSSEPEETPAAPTTTTSSSPSTEEATPEEEEEETPEETSQVSPPSEDNEEGNGGVDADVQNNMFIMLTGDLESSKNLSDGERIALGKEVCERIDSEDLQFQELADWVKEEGGFPDGDGGFIVSTANTLFCPESEIAQWDGKM